MSSKEVIMARRRRMSPAERANHVVRECLADLQQYMLGVDFAKLKPVLAKHIAWAEAELETELRQNEINLGYQIGQLQREIDRLREMLNKATQRVDW